MWPPDAWSISWASAWPTVQTPENAHATISSATPRSLAMRSLLDVFIGSRRLCCFILTRIVSLQVCLHDVNELIRGVQLSLSRLPPRIDDVFTNVALENLRHQPI